MNRLVRRSLSVLLAATAFGAAVWQILHPAPRQHAPAAETPLPAVAVLDAQPGAHPLRIRAWGRVVAEDALDLRARVGGNIEKRHPQLYPGGVIPAGEPLVEIDPADYRLAVREAEARLAKAQAQRVIEGGKHRLAKKELRMLQDHLRGEERASPLTLREPQLRAAQAEVALARAGLERARLDLERCRPRLAFDALVLTRDRTTGELVDRGERIARLAPADHFQVRLHLPPERLPWLKRGITAITLHQAGHDYPARFERIDRQLDDRTRQLQVVARIDDPLDRTGRYGDRPPLLLGSLVQARIELGSLDGVVALPREYLLDDDRVWVVDADNRLRIRPVRRRFTGPAEVLIDPLPAGDRLLRGNPAGLTPGTRVKIRTS